MSRKPSRRPKPRALTPGKQRDVDKNAAELRRAIEALQALRVGEWTSAARGGLQHHSRLLARLSERLEDGELFHESSYFVRHGLPLTPEDRLLYAFALASRNPEYLDRNELEDVLAKGLLPCDTKIDPRAFLEVAREFGFYFAADALWILEEETLIGRQWKAGRHNVRVFSEDYPSRDDGTSFEQIEVGIDREWARAPLSAVIAAALFEPLMFQTGLSYLCAAEDYRGSILPGTQHYLVLESSISHLRRTWTFRVVPVDASPKNGIWLSLRAKIVKGDSR